MHELFYIGQLDYAFSEAFNGIKCLSAKYYEFTRDTYQRKAQMIITAATQNGVDCNSLHQLTKAGVSCFNSHDYHTAECKKNKIYQRILEDIFGFLLTRSDNYCNKVQNIVQ